jgi:hypothetical protein
MAASMGKTLRSICSISLSTAKLHFCIHPATYVSSGDICRWLTSEPPPRWLGNVREMLPSPMR